MNFAVCLCGYHLEIKFKPGSIKADIRFAAQGVIKMPTSILQKYLSIGSSYSPNTIVGIYMDNIYFRYLDNCQINVSVLQSEFYPLRAFISRSVRDVWGSLFLTTFGKKKF